MCVSEATNPQPTKYTKAYNLVSTDWSEAIGADLLLLSVVAEDIAEEIVWAASRPPHVNLAEVYVLPVNQASPTLSYRGSK